MSTDALWWNFATNTSETIPGPLVDLSPDEAAQYVPQHPAAQGLFRCHVGLGKSVPEALVATLSAAVGREPQP